MTANVVVGAGPAGLTIARELVACGDDVVVLEADPHYVGGLSRTVRYQGHRFDIGGHRFYSLDDDITALWHELLPGQFDEVPRLSRIRFDGRWFPYPLQIWPTLRILGPRRSCHIAASYVWARLRPQRPEVTFEDWVVNRFGRDLYETFFRSYTEKVWGMRCDEMSKDFAAQRIRGLTLAGVVAHRLNGLTGRPKAKSLVERFLYPRHGPGQLWEAVAAQVVTGGGTIRMDAAVTTIERGERGAEAVYLRSGERVPVDALYTTMPLRDVVAAMDPPPPDGVCIAAAALRFRDFLTVAVVVNRAAVFPDTWIYVHDPDVAVGRIQNYRNWSAAMVAHPEVTCLGLEYFCNRGDEIWDAADEDLLERAERELVVLGLVDPGECAHGIVVRMADAYPVYDADYQTHRRTIRTWLEASVPNLQPAGRGGLHNYNSQDHAMVTGMYAVANARSVERLHDQWAVNTAEEYAEGGGSNVAHRLVPTRVLKAPEPGSQRPTADGSPTGPVEPE